MEVYCWCETGFYVKVVVWFVYVVLILDIWDLVVVYLIVELWRFWVFRGFVCVGFLLWFSELNVVFGWYKTKTWCCLLVLGRFSCLLVLNLVVLQFDLVFCLLVVEFVNFGILNFSVVLGICWFEFCGVVLCRYKVEFSGILILFGKFSRLGVFSDLEFGSLILFPGY